MVGFKLNPPNSWSIPYVVVYYTGSFNWKGPSSSSHGNLKATPAKSAAKFVRELTGEVTPCKLVPDGNKKSSLDYFKLTPMKFNLSKLLIIRCEILIVLSCRSYWTGSKEKNWWTTKTLQKR